MNILLEAVRVEDKSVLRNLLELCHHDYSEFNGMDLDTHGLYGYEYLDPYWTEPDRYPFFIRVEGKLAGFVMVSRFETPTSGDTYAIAEFFVLRKYRRQGVGKIAAYHIFDMFPGKWSIDQEPGNIPAQTFWRKIIAEYTHNNYQETTRETEGELRPNQLFVSNTVPQS